MNTVDRIRAILKDCRIPVSRMEKDLGFGNGYIGQLRKGTLPADRLSKISSYLNVDANYLLTGDEEQKKPTAISDDELKDNELNEYLEMLRTRPECRMLMSTVKGATKEQVEANVKFLESLRNND